MQTEHHNFQKCVRELENTCKYKGKIATLQLRACPKFRHQLNLRNRNRKTTNLDNELATNFANENLANLIFKKKLVALLLERHFALAASFQLYGNKAWKKLRVASNEISFGQLIGAKELHQQLRREQLDCKDLRSASFRALCPSNFEDDSFTEETFKEETFPEESFDESSFEAASYKDSSLKESSFEDSSLEESSFEERSFEKSSLEASSFDEHSSLQQSSLEESSFDKSSLEESSFDKHSFYKSSLEESSFDKSSLEESSFDQSSFEGSSLEESSFDKSSFEVSSLEPNRFEDNSFQEASLADLSLQRRTSPTELAELTRRASRTELAELEQAALHTELSELERLALKKAALRLKLSEASLGSYLCGGSLLIATHQLT